ncbi:hypothetical protein C8F04DRAFT_1330295 [Mycena alexandri]|uniref:Uncharacterized protein n=1 Tax=Mycena alexandri TaxID=1745969 RepID=A0AAD6WL50_9AGAR|nr:hypothetical protein C8F04DRAFT_1330295 [Mycena alexandri]
MNNPGYYGKGSVKVSSPTNEHDGPIRRLAISADKLVTQSFAGIDTVYDVLQYGYEYITYVQLRAGRGDCTGARRIGIDHAATRWVPVFSHFKFVGRLRGLRLVWGTRMRCAADAVISSLRLLRGGMAEEAVRGSEVGNAVRATAARRAFSACPRAYNRGGLTRGGRGALHWCPIVHGGADLQVPQTGGVGCRRPPHPCSALVCVNCQLLARSCGSISITIATANDTLGPASPTHSLNEPTAQRSSPSPTLLAVLPNTPSVKTGVFDGTLTPKLHVQLAEARGNIPVLSLDDLRKRGQATKEAIDPGVLAARRPAPSSVSCIVGIVIPHANLVASGGAVDTLLGHGHHLTADHAARVPTTRTHPRGHRRAVHALWRDADGVWANQDADGRECAEGIVGKVQAGGAMGILRISGRALWSAWETVRKGIGGKVQAGGAIRSCVFKGVVEAKKLGTPGLALLADSGGYGMIESCAMCAIMPPEVFRFDSVTVPSIELKLRGGILLLRTTGRDGGARESRVLDARVDPKVAALVLRECNVAGKKATETLTAVVLTPDGWTPESELGYSGADDPEVRDCEEV